MDTTICSFQLPAGWRMMSWKNVSSPYIFTTYGLEQLIGDVHFCTRSQGIQHVEPTFEIICFNFFVCLFKFSWNMHFWLSYTTTTSSTTNRSMEKICASSASSWTFLPSTLAHWTSAASAACCAPPGAPRAVTRGRRGEMKLRCGDWGTALLSARMGAREEPFDN